MLFYWYIQQDFRGNMPLTSVIIVEDQPEVADMLAEMLRVSDFHAVICNFSAPAIKMIAGEKPDPVLLDVMMPDMSGYDVLKSMRADAQLARIPVILISALSQPIDISTGLAAGASAFLTKPVDFLELKNTVERLTKTD
jgi:DNA-binding response OmpR family regulator